MSSHTMTSYSYVMRYGFVWYEIPITIYLLVNNFLILFIMIY